MRGGPYSLADLDWRGGGHEIFAAVYKKPNEIILINILLAQKHTGLKFLDRV